MFGKTFGKNVVIIYELKTHAQTTHVDKPENRRRYFYTGGGVSKITYSRERLFLTAVEISTTSFSFSGNKTAECVALGDYSVVHNNSETILYRLLFVHIIITIIIIIIIIIV